MLLFFSPGEQGKGRQTQGSDCFRFGEGAGGLGTRSLQGEGYWAQHPAVEVSGAGVG